jgi:hypothetical protein
MTQTAIFAPFFATVFLTLVVCMYRYVRRINFITSNKISSRDLAVPGALAKLSPPAVSNPSHNLKNLFEIPVIFYALALYLFITKQVDTIYIGAAWVFVAFRVLHSAVHCHFQPRKALLLSLSHCHARGLVHRSTSRARIFRRIGRADYELNQGCRSGARTAEISYRTMHSVPLLRQSPTSGVKIRP